MSATMIHPPLEPQAAASVCETSGRVMTRHLLVIDDGGDTLATALRWVRRNAAATDRITVLTTYSHVAPMYGPAEFLIATTGAAPSESDLRESAAMTVRNALGSSDAATRVRHVVQRGYAHRVVAEHACDATVVVVAQSSSQGWVDRLSPSPARRLIGRTPGPLIVVPHDWDAED